MLGIATKRATTLAGSRAARTRMALTTAGVALALGACATPNAPQRGYKVGLLDGSNVIEHRGVQLNVASRGDLGSYHALMVEVSMMGDEARGHELHWKQDWDAISAFLTNRIQSRIGDYYEPATREAPGVLKMVVSVESPASALSPSNGTPKEVTGASSDLSPEFLEFLAAARMMASFSDENSGEPLAVSIAAIGTPADGDDAREALGAWIDGLAACLSEAVSPDGPNLQSPPPKIPKIGGPR